MARTTLALVTLVSGFGIAHAQATDSEEPPVPTPTPAPAAPPAAEPTPTPAPPPPVAAPAPVATGSVEAPADGEPAPLASGFAIEVRVETGQMALDSDTALPVMQPGVFLGHRSKNLTIGVGLELSRLAHSRSESDGMGGTSDVSENVTSLLVLPGLRFAMARSADQRTELLGQIDVGIGGRFFGASDNASPAPESIHRFRLQAGPAIRHWVSPSFAVGATAGLRYDRMSVSNGNDTGYSSEVALATTDIFGSLQLTAVF